MSNGSIDVVVEVVVEIVVRVEHIRFPDESLIQFPTAGCCVVVTPVQSVLIHSIFISIFRRKGRKFRLKIFFIHLFELTVHPGVVSICEFIL